MKPTRAAFTEQVRAEWPGATFIEGDRGLYIVVGSADVAMSIAAKAAEAALRVAGIDVRGPEDFLVRVFGFPRARKEKP